MSENPIYDLVVADLGSPEPVMQRPKWSLHDANLKWEAHKALVEAANRAPRVTFGQSSTNRNQRRGTA